MHQRAHGLLVALLLAACGTQPEVLPETPPSSPVAASGAWATLAALGFDPLAPPVQVALGEEGAADVLVGLRPAAVACSSLHEGRCHAGCFTIMAATAEPSLTAVRVEILDPDDPDELIAASVTPGSVARAGFCYGFAPGSSGHLTVLARLWSHGGAGAVEVAGWRHPMAERRAPPELDLRLPALATPAANLRAAEPQCDASWDQDTESCDIVGPIAELPMGHICEGCERWRYRFSRGLMREAVFLRAVADITAEYFGVFADEATWVAAALERAHGPSEPPEDLANWEDVEAAGDEGGDYIVMQRRVWSGGDARVVWELRGLPGHHPVAELVVTLSPPQDATNR